MTTGCYEKFVKSMIRTSNLPQRLRDFLVGDKKLAFYGAGMQAFFLLDFCNMISRSVECAIVTDRTISGEPAFKRQTLEILTIEDFKEKHENEDYNIIVAVNEMHNESILGNLKRNGIPDEAVCTVHDWKKANAEMECLAMGLNLFMLENGLLRPVMGVISELGGSFKQYLLEHNMPEVLAALKRGLDISSLEVLERSLFKILYVPDSRFEKFLFLSIPPFESAFRSRKFYEMREKCSMNAKKYQNAFFGVNPLGGEFVHHHGLFLADAKVKEYMRGKDFLDCGAYDGGSALIFMKFYQPRKVYSFDLSPINCENYKEIMRLNTISSDRYELINCGVSDIPGTAHFKDGDGFGTSLLHAASPGCGASAELIRIDDFVESTSDMDVGLIKFDLEGHGLKAVKGMEKTIKQFRPVLLFAIYHCPEEFFEIKPLLDEFTKDLGYRISLIDNGSNSYDLEEICLFAHPEM